MAASAVSRLPIGLLDRDEEAEEVLFLSYSANLEFFERAVLGRTRELQARATVISDSAMVSSDPMAVRHAGVQYLDARAVAPGGAFHPKLIVIAGPEAVTLAVGSGNLTLAGWHANAELWTVMRGDGGSVPDTFAQAAGLLRGLGTSPITFSPGATEALNRAAALLDRDATQFPGPRLVSSLAGPIIDQLPHGPVDELVAYAPFHDARLAGLRALVERLRPESLTVFVGPDTTVGGAQLEGYLADVGGRLAWTTGRPHHHGKLIEWRIGSQRWALTGSPNLSAPALLSSVAGGANLEIGLVSRVEDTLHPEEAAVPSQGVAGLRGPEPRHEPLARAVLLAAVAEGDSTRLHLASPLGEPAGMEVFDQESGSFVALAGDDIAPGAASHVISPGLSAGTALQLVLRTSQVRSNRVYVTDMDAVARRPLRSIGKTKLRPDQLVLGDAFEHLLDDIDALRPFLLRMRIVEPVSTGRPADGADAVERGPARLARGRSLEEYLDGVRSVLGDSLTSWALSLPMIPGAEDERVLDAAALVTETEAELEDPQERVRVHEEPLEEAIDGLSDYQRRRLRNFSRRLLQRARSALPIVRVLAARLVLHAIAAQLWPEPDEQGEVTLAAIEVLGAPGDEPTAEEQVAMASVGAVLLALLRAQVARRSVRDEAELRLERGFALLAALLEDCSTREIARLSAQLQPRLGAVVSTDAVLEVALEATSQERGYARAIELLDADHGLVAEERDGAIVFHQELPLQCEYRLILAVSLVGEDLTTVIVRGRTKRGPVVAVWRAPWLVISHTREGGQRGELYGLFAGAEPSSLVAASPGGDVSEALPRRTAQWMPGQPPQGVAADLLALAQQGAN